MFRTTLRVLEVSLVNPRTPRVAAQQEFMQIRQDFTQRLSADRNDRGPVDVEPIVTVSTRKTSGRLILGGRSGW